MEAPPGSIADRVWQVAMRRAESTIQLLALFRDRLEAYDAGQAGVAQGGIRLGPVSSEHGSHVDDIDDWDGWKVGIWSRHGPRWRIVDRSGCAADRPSRGRFDWHQPIPQASKRLLDQRLQHLVWWAGSDSFNRTEDSG